MNYGVGTYRGATMSLAAELGAEHEPPEQLGYDATRFVHFPHDGKLKRRLLERIRLRARKYPNGIVDAAQSYVIHLIQEADPDAHFHWIMRDPFEVVGSLVHASSVWKSHDASAGQKLIYPKPGWPPNVTRIEQAAYYYYATHTRICQTLAGFEYPDHRIANEHFQRGRWTFYRPTDLKIHTNQHGKEGHRRFSPRQASIVAKRCWPIWQEAA